MLSLDSSSTSCGDKEKGIVNQIDAIKKGRRHSGFEILADVEKKKPKRRGRCRREKGLSARNCPPHSDFLQTLFRDPELLQVETKYTLLQLDWSQALCIAKYMDELIVKRIKIKASNLPDFEDLYRGRHLFCAGTQRLSNDQIRTVINKIVEILHAEKLQQFLSQSVYPLSPYAKF